MQAQDGDLCYVVTTSGRRLNLRRLCNAEEAAPLNSKADVYRVKIKQRLASTPVIEVWLNGQPFDMILDTGASHTLITQNMAQTLGLQPQGYVAVTIADGSSVNLPIGSVRSVQVAGIRAQDLKVIIANKANVGLLGHDFFGGFDIQIKRNEVEFSPHSGG
jgi:clan AA aspartic protease (TIGR02281 family)